jgi:HK97 family phage portal protein
MQLSLADAQTLESRRFQVADIARLFGVPPHMIGETDKTSSWGTGVEQQTIGFQIYNLEPELSRIEGELNRKLFTSPYYCEFNREAWRRWMPRRFPSSTPAASERTVDAKRSAPEAQPS